MDTWNEAAKYGKLDILKWGQQIGDLFQNRYQQFRLVPNISCEAGKGGYLLVLQWLYENKHLTRDFLPGAASNGHLEVFKWTIEHNIGKIDKLDFDILINLIQGGQLHILQWAHNTTQNLEMSLNTICRYALSAGQHNIAEWALNNDCGWITYDKVCSNSLQFLQWLQTKGVFWQSRSVCLFAAQNGNLEIIQWALQNGCEWDTECGRFAATRGHLGILIWAQNNGYAVDMSVCGQIAIREGYMNIINWVHKNGGNVNPLAEFLPEHMKREKISFIKWGLENGTEMSFKCWTVVVKDEIFEILELVYKFQPHQNDSFILQSVLLGKLKLLHWAKKRGCKFTSNSHLILEAAKSGSIEVVKWVLAHVEGNTRDISFIAAMWGNFSVMKWAIFRGLS